MGHVLADCDGLLKLLRLQLVVFTVTLNTCTVKRYPDSVVFEGVCNLELSITQKYIENTISTLCHAYSHAYFFKFNLESGFKGRPVERDVCNLHVDDWM